jgi:cytidylate kinase
VPGVRRALLPLQREIAKTASVVMEGRDIGTVIFPEAQVKVFLDAHPHERARRRANEWRSVVAAAGVETVAAEIQERDARDRARPESPLVQAPDAVLLDTTELSVDQVEERILQLVRARTSNGKEVHR